MEATVGLCTVHTCGLFPELLGSLIRLDKVKQSGNSFVISIAYLPHTLSIFCLFLLKVRFSGQVIQASSSLPCKCHQSS